MPTKDLFVYTWGIQELDSKSWTQTETIYAYGIDKKNKTTCCIIRNFKPFVHVELPEHINWIERVGGSTRLHRVANALRSTLGCLANVQNESRFALKYKLYGYNIDETTQQKKKIPYLILRFHNMKQIYNLRSKLQKKINIEGLGSIQLHVRECGTSPLTQFLSEYDIPTTGWISISSKFLEPDDRISRCDNEYELDCNLLKTGNSSISAIPNGDMDIPPVQPTIMAWDIETYSYDGSFPKPTHPGNCVFQISCVLSILKKRKKILLTLGNVSDIENAQVLCFKTEWELLEGFATIINEYKPHCMIGWNIFGFDIEYILCRAAIYHCLPNLTNFGMIKNYAAKEKKINWQSKAYGTTNLTILQPEGILTLDIMDTVQKGYKLDSYSLNAVAHHFLESSKDDVSAVYMWKSYEKSSKNPNDIESIEGMTKVGKYCIKDSELVLDIFEHLQLWISFTEMSRICSTTIMDLHTRGQQARIFNQIFRHCYKNKTVVDKEDYKVSETERYRGATVQDPIPGMYENVAPLDFGSLYPSIMIAYNLDYSTFITDSDYDVLKNIHGSEYIDNSCHVMKWEDHVLCEHDPQVIEKKILSEKINKYKIVLKIYSQIVKKIRKIHENLKSVDNINMWASAVFKISYIADDLKSELKSELQYIVHDKISTWSMLRKKMSDMQKQRTLVTKKLGTSGIMCATRTYRFIKEDVHKGVIPTIIQNLLDARKQVRAQIAKLKSDSVAVKRHSQSAKILEQIAILEQRQLALKVCANSMYGATGVKAGMLPFMPVAMCTTYQGRLCVAKAENLVTKKYGGDVIYKDTDSNYVVFKKYGNSPKALWDYAVYVAKQVSNEFPSPITLEFENAIYNKFLILTKKRYMYYSCGEDGNVIVDKSGTPKLGKRGIILSRRDNSKFMKDVYTKFITTLFESYPNINLDDIHYNILQDILNLFYRCVSTQDFIITKTVNDYKQDEYEKTGTFTPILGKNENGQDKWKIGSYCVSYLSDEMANNMTKHQIGKFYLEQLPAQVQLHAKMNERGDVPDEGQRLSFVVCSSLSKFYDAHLKISQKIESPEYIARNPRLFRIDYLYYLERLIEPIDQILSAITIEKKVQTKTKPYSPIFKKKFPKLYKLFETRSASSLGNKLLKSTHKTCVAKQAMLKELYMLSKPNLIFMEI